MSTCAFVRSFHHAFYHGLNLSRKSSYSNHFSLKCRKFRGFEAEISRPHGVNVVNTLPLDTLLIRNYDDGAGMHVSSEVIRLEKNELEPEFRLNKIISIISAMFFVVMNFASPSLALAGFCNYGLSSCNINETYSFAMDTSEASILPKEFPALREISLPAYSQVVLKNGLRVFLLEDHEMGLVGGQLFVRGGSSLDPPNMIGLSTIASSVQRNGGTTTLSSEELNDFLESMAARIETGSSPSQMGVGFRCLSGDLDSVFPIFADVVRGPRMPADKVELTKSQLVGSIERRNDDPSSMASRELLKLVYGSSNPFVRFPDKEGALRISQRDVVQFHKASFQPEKSVLGIWGDFNPQEMAAYVEERFGDWERQSNGLESSTDGPVVETETGYSAVPGGTYLLDRPGLSQGYVRMGELGIQLDNEDLFPLDVLDSTLNGFGGRLFDQIRSRKSLAYSVSGSFSPAIEHKGFFMAGGETQSSSVAKLVQALQELLTEATVQAPDPEEVQRAKDSTLNSFVFNFADSGSQLSRVMTNDLFGIDQDFILRYMRRIGEVRPQDVLEAAQRRLHPRAEPIVVVADSASVRPELEKLGLPVFDLQVSD